MSRSKYSDDFKLQIVNEYLEGKNGGMDTICHKYGIAKSAALRWVRLYKVGGTTALFHTPGTYSGDFKIYAVEYMHQHSLSMQEASAHFYITTPTVLGKWERIYYEEGKEALLIERRGRPRKVSGIKKGRPPKKDVNKNEDLLAEVQRLRMENDYLKKLNALIQEREKQQQKSK